VGMDRVRPGCVCRVRAMQRSSRRCVFAIIATPADKAKLPPERLNFDLRGRRDSLRLAC
jgi:hypothetical protein